MSINILYGQTHTGLEGYYYPGSYAANAIVPKVYFQSTGGWYGEARYNYEKEQTGSLYGGYTFSGGHDWSWSVTPLAGILAGHFHGVSAAMNAELNFKRICFSSEGQYAMSFAGGQANFLFSWSEFGYQLTEHFYSGIALQQTGLCRTGNAWEPGVQISISLGDWRFPVYFFDAPDARNYVVLGISRDWVHEKRNNHKNPIH